MTPTIEQYAPGKHTNHHTETPVSRKAQRSSSRETTRDFMGTNYPKEIDILSLSGAYGLRVCEQSDSQKMHGTRT